MDYSLTFLVHFQCFYFILILSLCNSGTSLASEPWESSIFVFSRSCKFIPGEYFAHMLIVKIFNVFSYSLCVFRHFGGF